jgi:hypothetical protein
MEKPKRGGAEKESSGGTDQTRLCYAAQRWISPTVFDFKKCPSISSKGREL